MYMYRHTHVHMHMYDSRRQASATHEVQTYLHDCVYCTCTYIVSETYECTWDYRCTCTCVCACTVSTCAYMHMYMYSMYYRYVYIHKCTCTYNVCVHVCTCNVYAHTPFKKPQLIHTHGKGTDLESFREAYSAMSMLKDATIFLPLGPSCIRMWEQGSERHRNQTQQTHSHCYC